MTSDIMHIETDVLVVGSGVAGMMAVVGCMRSGVKPVIATKGTYASGASSMARGGHSLALGHSDAEDNPELFFEDIFAGSGDIGNPRLIDIVGDLITYKAATRSSRRWSRISTSRRRSSPSWNRSSVTM